MPICTVCTSHIPHLYTIYHSAHNLRLEQCSECHSFADPYVEHDTLTIILDLILLKRSVYRHLLYNRASEPRRAAGGHSDPSVSVGDITPREERIVAAVNIGKTRKDRWMLILQLGAALVLVDAFIRWMHIHTRNEVHPQPWAIDTAQAFGRIFLGCLAETVAFHGGILLSCTIVLQIVNAFRSWRIRRQINRGTSNRKLSQQSGIRKEFRYTLIPLTLLYSSLTKLFLLFLLSIWRPTTTPVSSAVITHDGDATTYQNASIITRHLLPTALRILDEDFLDREWIVRNVLGGMSAGFGLRVVLDIHPSLTTIIIFSGWAVKTLIANAVFRWVGGGKVGAGETWLAYSIP